jgi:hypothetical protein
MKLSLTEFEHQIDAKILKRGMQYFESGAVSDVEELGDGEFEATVYGTEIYTVNLTIKGDEVVDYSCDCPYDMGPVCKHVVAVLFAMQGETFDMEEIVPLVKDTKNTKATATQKKAPTVKEQVDKILEVTTDTQLRDYIREMCVVDKEFRLMFMAKFASLASPASKTLYAGQIRQCVDMYTGNHGYIEYRNARSLADMVAPIIDEGTLALEFGDVQKAMFVAMAALEELTKVINMADDSGGYIGGLISEADDILRKLSEAGIDDTFHSELFNTLVDTYEKGYMKGWDWHRNLLDYAINMVSGDKEKGRITTLLANIKPSGKHWDYDYRYAQTQMLALLRKTASEQEAVEYMFNHLGNSEFRKELISRAMSSEDYATARRLAEDGFKYDMKDAPGLADDWQHYLFDIYRKTGETKKALNLCTHFIVTSHGKHHPLQYYYDIAKSMVPADDWTGYYNSLILKVQGNYERLVQLYVMEKQWDKYLDLLIDTPSLRDIERAEAHLGKIYPQELATLYNDSILDLMKNSVGRSVYQEACRYIRKMKKLGYADMAEQLITKLRALYPSRRALMEELGNV